MNRIHVLFIAALLTLSLGACAGSPEASETTTTTQHHELSDTGDETRTSSVETHELDSDGAETTETYEVTETSTSETTPAD